MKSMRCLSGWNKRFVGGIIFQKRLYARQTSSVLTYADEAAQINAQSAYPVATIFGCTGFLGSYLTQEFTRVGYQVIVPYRDDPFKVQKHMVMGDVGQVVPMRYDPDNQESIEDICSRSNVVVNCIGKQARDILFDNMVKSNIVVPERIALAAADTEVDRFFHVSAQGCKPDHMSPMMQQKYQVEQYIKDLYPDVTIVRPNVMYGAGDRFLTYFGNNSRFVGFIPWVNGGESLTQPVWVANVADAIVASLRNNNTIGETLELAGPEILSIKDIVDFCDHSLIYNTDRWTVPKFIAKNLGRLNAFQKKNRYNEDLVSRMSEDNLCPIDAKFTFETLNVRPASIRFAGMEVLTRFSSEEFLYSNNNPDMRSRDILEKQ